jgi:hypothetical protein
VETAAHWIASWDCCAGGENGCQKVCCRQEGLWPIWLFGGWSAKVQVQYPSTGCCLGGPVWAFRVPKIRDFYIRGPS